VFRSPPDPLSESSEWRPGHLRGGVRALDLTLQHQSREHLRPILHDHDHVQPGDHLHLAPDHDRTHDPARLQAGTFATGTGEGEITAGALREAEVQVEETEGPIVIAAIPEIPVGRECRAPRLWWKNLQRT
jgi:hypothetical protein